MSPTRRWLAAAFVLFAACASERPAEAGEFDASGGRATVVLGAGEFAWLDGERLPFDAVVLRLRHRARSMTAEERARFVVRIEVAEALPEGADANVFALRDRLFDELIVMELRQAEAR